MIIALDYDDTFTADRVAWTKAMAIMLEYGHEVLIVSSRRDTPENRRQIMIDVTWIAGNDDIHLVYDEPKHDAMIRKGIKVDIWIDDNPKAIIYGR